MMKKSFILWLTILMIFCLSFASGPADAATVTVDDTDSRITYYSTSGWAHRTGTQYYNGTESYIKQRGAYAEFTFSGTAISLIATKRSDYGIANVYIDGQLAGTIDYYSPTALYQQVVYEKTGLTDGSHTIKIAVANEKNPASSNYYISIDAFRYVDSAPTPTPTPTPTPGMPEKPGPSNTGPTNPNILTPMSGTVAITQDGAVLENFHLTGTLRIQANNVTVRNFIIDATSWYGIQCTYGNTGLLVENGEVRGAKSSCVYGGGGTFRKLNIHDSSGDGFKITGNAFVERCWIHHLGTADGAHADGNQTRKGENITFRYNNFDMPVSVPAPYKSNAAFMIQQAEGPIVNFVIEYNWLNGGNYTIYSSGDVKIRNNRFGRDYKYGILNGTPTERSGNVWDDTGAPITI